METANFQSVDINKLNTEIQNVITKITSKKNSTVCMLGVQVIENKNSPSDVEIYVYGAGTDAEITHMLQQLILTVKVGLESVHNPESNPTEKTN